MNHFVLGEPVAKRLNGPGIGVDAHRTQVALAADGNLRLLDFGAQFCFGGGRANERPELVPRGVIPVYALGGYIIEKLPLAAELQVKLFDMKHVSVSFPSLE